MKKSVNIQNKHFLIEPISDNDSFFSCISFWLYGCTEQRQELRTKVLLHLVNITFRTNFDTIDTVITASYKKELCVKNNKLSKELYMKNNKLLKEMSVDDIIKFICVNKRVGIVSSVYRMCLVICDFLKVNMYVSRCHFYYNQNDNFTHTISIKKQRNKYKLMEFIGLRKTLIKTKYQLRVSKRDNEMKVVCDMKTHDLSYSCILHEYQSDWIYTVFPTQGCFHKKTIFVFVRDINSNYIKMMGSTLKENMNPYFYIDDFKDEGVEIIVIQRNTWEDAKKYILYERKLKLYK